MPVRIVRNDIAKMHADAIVNAANAQLSAGGGVCGALHAAAGPGLLQECMSLHGCKTGQVKVTGGYNLHCKYVIHAVGPMWQGGSRGERELLASCYRQALAKAQELGCRSIAFPILSSGIYGYPKAEALQVAMEEIGAFLMAQDMQVDLVVYTRESVEIGSKLFADIRQYIDDHYVAAHTDVMRRPDPPLMMESVACMPAPCAAPDLEEELLHLDESFSQAVLRLIGEKGMTNAQCYKKANLDRKHFSKIQNDVHYKPKKTTALALAVALELSLDETKALLQKAGLAISHSDVFDVIVEFFIRQEKYDIFVINEALFLHDQPMLGSVLP